MKMKKLRPEVLLSISSVLAVACGTGGVADTPRPSSRASHDAVQAAASAHITIDFPGATSTEVNDINADGDVVGRYTLRDGISHGFLRDSAGSFTTIDFPGAIFTTPKGINRDGDIVGGCIAADGLTHGFLLSDGEFTQIDFSDTTATFPTGIDSEGDIVGGYCVRPCNPVDVNARRLHGFFLSNEKFVTFDVPGSTSTALIHTSRQRGSAGIYKDANDVPHGFVLKNGALRFIDVPGAVGTWALGMNRSGVVVGSWCDGSVPCSLIQPGNHAFKLGQQGFELFDFPGAANSRAWAINDRGDIAGAFRGPQDPLRGVTHGFVIVQADDDDHATFTTIDVPGALATFVVDINNAGDMVGRYCPDQSCAGSVGPTGNWRGFLLSDGEVTSIEYPGAFHTNATGINARGDIVGRYRNSTTGGFHGYLLSDGEFTPIDYPGAFSTRPYGITSDGGVIVGDYCTVPGCIGPASGPYHAFVLRGGEFTSFDFPGAVRTHALKINSRGQIVGWYVTTDRVSHNFLLSNGTFTSIDYPGAGNTGGDAAGINARGDIVSSYCVAKGCSSAAQGAHGFLLSRGNFTSFDFPGARGTNAFGINSRGDIVGGYLDTGLKIHGYLKAAKRSGDSE
jgi:uncharacterized membrane protein